MKRWLVVLLIVLALIILVSPGIVGRLAEKNIEDGITWTETESPGVTITTETFERGWFTSEGRHHVVLEGGQFREASEKYAAATGNANLPSLIIDTRVDHGLLPVTSLSRDEGSLAPGLASTVSSFKVDPGNGEPVEVPGALYSNVGLSGASDSHLLLEPGSYSHDGASMQWQGADLMIRADPAARGRAVEGTVDAIALKGAGIDAGFESLSITADQSATNYGFNIGSADIELIDRQPRTCRRAHDPHLLGMRRLREISHAEHVSRIPHRLVFRGHRRVRTEAGRVRAENAVPQFELLRDLVIRNNRPRVPDADDFDFGHVP